jgi:hypothetical protein
MEDRMPDKDEFNAPQKEADWLEVLIAWRACFGSRDISLSAPVESEQYEEENSGGSSAPGQRAGDRRGD